MWHRLVAAIVFSGLLAGHAADLTWEKEAAGRSASVVVSGTGTNRAGLQLLPPDQTGIWFTNVLPQVRHRTNQILLNGSGVAAGDVDGDGWCDVYFCGLDRPNALYRNLGNWRFQDVAAEAGVRCEGLTSTGAALVDFDGDGDLDLVVNSLGHGTRLFINDGKGRFALAGVLNLNKGGMSMALGDLNGDGYLDLYISNYRTLALMDMPNTRFNFATANGQRVVSRVNGRPAVEPDLTNRFRVNARGGIEENGETDEIYFNVNGGALQPVLFTGGSFLNEDGQPLADAPVDWGLSVLIRDVNQDGRPDIWVCNDFDTPDRIWLNQGGGKFRAAPRLAFRKMSHFSMGIDVADINRDGWDDVLILDMLSRDHAVKMDMLGDRNPAVPQPGAIDNRPDYMMNALFLNRGDGTYAEMAQLAGLAATEWSWTPVFLDLDLDGYEDVLVANGNERAARSMDVSERLRALRSGRQLSNDEIFDNRKLFPRQNSPNFAFRNRGDLTFEDTSREWGFAFDGVSHGMALADLDNDGDMDVLVNNLNGLAGVYRNEATGPRVAVRLRGVAPNTHGIGARVSVRAPQLPVQAQEIQCGGRYLSSDEAVRTFASGTARGGITIEVEWPDGRWMAVSNARPNRIYELDQAAAMKRERSPKAPVRPWFADVSDRLKHRHHEELFDDFARQPLLPQRFSQLGPGAAWGDVDGDGTEDLIVGSGQGGRLAVLRNKRQTFEPLRGGAFDETTPRDQTAILPIARPGGVELLVGTASYEDGQTNGAMVRIYDVKGKAGRDLIPSTLVSVGPMATADYDGDGVLDLFVGGRMVVERYPATASSALWKGAATGVTRDDGNAAIFGEIGMVSGAVFTDLDGDGDPDLVLACDWGPLKVLRNDRGHFSAWKLRLTAAGTNTLLDDLRGLWNGVTTGDFDGDGRMDVVASNCGRNSRYEESRGAAIELVYGDFDGGAAFEIIESHWDSRMRKMVPDRQLDYLARAMPFLREKFQSNQEFGRAGVDEILRGHEAGARRVGINWLESTVFLNRGDHFEVRVLPIEAQFAPAFGICTADFNGDGTQDVFLAQNFFAGTSETPRQDAGLGLILAGDGRGGFRSLSGEESGVRIFGEQRGAAVCDFDGDGLVDLAVTQNGGETKLYRNAGAGTAGLRIHLAGPEANRQAVGAQLRAMMGEALGPAVELHGGGGYWSRDSVVPVLTGPKNITGVWVRWPGGKVTTHPVAGGVREVRVDAGSQQQ